MENVSVSIKMGSEWKYKVGSVERMVNEFRYRVSVSKWPVSEHTRRMCFLKGSVYRRT